MQTSDSVVTITNVRSSDKFHAENPGSVSSNSDHRVQTMIKPKMFSTIVKYWRPVRKKLNCKKSTDKTKIKGRSVKTHDQSL